MHCTNAQTCDDETGDKQIEFEGAVFKVLESRFSLPEIPVVFYN